ncbi:MAG: NADH:ubiquinone reductase (Na(+)-transporting) subunit B [Bacteriovoracaceae bacterium]
MQFLRDFLDKQEKHFEHGGKFEKFYPLYEALDTFVYTPSSVTKGSTHLRDGLDLKRMMVTVAMALMPCILWALYNTGYQANSVIANGGAAIDGWRGTLFAAFGLIHDPANIFANVILGAIYFVPIFIVANVVGGFWEVLFATIRKHEVNEGFMVTGLLFPLILPPTIPLWQVAVGISFGVVVGKEIFGGTGKNFLNIALLSRAYLYFAYPAQISGDAVWYAVDGYTGATALGQAALGGIDAVSWTWWEAFFGLMPGSMGETSTLACLLGAGYLVATGIGSWRTMVSLLLGMIVFSLFLNMVGSETNPMFMVSPAWHLVLGGFAFGMVFMATDPVTSAMTLKGQWFYGALIGVMTVLVRVINPAFPEGIMLAILFANTFAPLIDYFVVDANVKRRELRNAKG